MLLAAFAAVAAVKHKPLPAVQLQVSTRVETTAHQLNATEDYPPYKRYYTVYFDFPVRRHAGHALPSLSHPPLAAPSTLRSRRTRGRACTATSRGRPVRPGAPLSDPGGDPVGVSPARAGSAVAHRLRAGAAHAAQVIRAAIRPRL